jgi:hypothetical protein
LDPQTRRTVSLTRYMFLVVKSPKGRFHSRIAYPDISLPALDVLVKGPTTSSKCPTMCPPYFNIQLYLHLLLYTNMKSLVVKMTTSTAVILADRLYVARKSRIDFPYKSLDPRIRHINLKRTGLVYQPRNSQLDWGEIVIRARR